MKSFNKRPVIITLVGNEKYQQLLGDVDADFIVYQCHGALEINKKLPNNHRVVNDLTPDIRPDILLSQNKITHYRTMKSLADKYGRPLFSLFLNTPNVYDVEKTIDHVADEEIFFSLDHASIWESDNPSIIPICPSGEVNQTNGLFSNRMTTFNCIYDIINNMASGKCVISPAVFEANVVIKHGHTGLLYDKNNNHGEEEIIKRLMYNEDLIKEIGQNAKKSILTNYSKDSFTENWNNLIYDYFEKE